jgi:hypothetical protein
MDVVLHLPHPRLLVLCRRVVVPTVASSLALPRLLDLL